MQSFLHEVGFWDKDQEASLIQQATEEINQAVETYLNVPSQPSTDMLDYLYHQLPKAMQEQRDELEEKLAIEGVRTHG